MIHQEILAETRTTIRVQGTVIQVMGRVGQMMVILTEATLKIKVIVKEMATQIAIRMVTSRMVKMAM